MKFNFSEIIVRSVSGLILFFSVIIAFSAVSNVQPVMNGKYIGIGIGMNNLNNEYNNNFNNFATDSVFIPVSNYNIQYSGNVNQPLLGTRVIIGYQKIFNQTYILGAEFAAGRSFGSSTYTDQADDQLTFSPIAMQRNTFKTTAEYTYNLDLAIKPGLLFTDTLVGYLKMGLSLARLNTKLEQIHNTSLLLNTFAATPGSDTRNVWGYVAGMGIEKYLTSRLAVTGEYNFYRYQNYDLPTVTFVENGISGFPSIINSRGTYRRSMTPYVNSFQVGLLYYVT